MFLYGEFDFAHDGGVTHNFYFLHDGREMFFFDPTCGLRLRAGDDCFRLSDLELWGSVRQFTTSRQLETERTKDLVGPGWSRSLLSTRYDIELSKRLMTYDLCL